MKRTHLAAILVPLALALPSCGGDDSKNESTAPASADSPAAPAENPQRNSNEGAGGDASAEETAAPGSGGSSSADAERAARQPGKGKKQTPSDDRPTAPRPERKAEPKTPQEQIAGLSPSERRKLHKDLYEQGKNVCFAYGPKQLAKEYHLTGSSSQTIAQQYARLYEAATPTLILPFQQGCLAGFRKFARNPPKS